MGARRIPDAFARHLLGLGDVAVRLLALHNLTFMAELMDGLRAAIRDGRYADHARDVLAGRSPYAA